MATPIDVVVLKCRKICPTEIDEIVTKDLNFIWQWDDCPSCIDRFEPGQRFEHLWCAKQNSNWFIWIAGSSQRLDLETGYSLPPHIRISLPWTSQRTWNLFFMSILTVVFLNVFLFYVFILLFGAFVMFLSHLQRLNLDLVDWLIDWLMVQIEPFPASFHNWGATSEYWSKLWCSKWGWVILSAYFRGNGVLPPTTLGVRELESLGYHVALFAWFYI